MRAAMRNDSRWQAQQKRMAALRAAWVSYRCRTQRRANQKDGNCHEGRARGGSGTVKLGASKATQRPASRSRIVGSLRGRVCGWKGKSSVSWENAPIFCGYIRGSMETQRSRRGVKRMRRRAHRTVGSMWLNEEYSSVAAGRTCHSQGHSVIFCVSYEVKTSCEQGGIQGVW